MTRLMKARPSELVGLTNAYEAWCLDEAIAYLILELENGNKLKHPKTKDNSELLRKMGVK